MKAMLLFPIVTILVVVSIGNPAYGFRGHHDPKVIGQAIKDRAQFMDYAKQYAKRYNVSFYKLYRNPSGSRHVVTRNKRNVTPSDDKWIPVDVSNGNGGHARYLGLLMMPGASGSYSSSNSFYLFGKLVNSAMSLSFSPIQGNGIAPILPPVTSAAAGAGAAGAGSSSTKDEDMQQDQLDNEIPTRTQQQQQQQQPLPVRLYQPYPVYPIIPHYMILPYPNPYFTTRTSTAKPNANEPRASAKS